MALVDMNVPAAGKRIGVECGPGEFAKDNAGTVITQMTDRWGTYVLVMMDSGKVEKCHGLNAGPGIGWHAV